MPAGTTFVSASDSWLLNGSTVEWSLGTLSPGQSGTRTVTVEANAGLVRGTLLPAQAELSDTSAPAQLARARAVTEIDGLDPLELAMAVGPDPAAVGEQLGIELTVTNTSASALTAVTLVLRWPHRIDPLFTGTGDLLTRGLQPDRQQRGLLGRRVHRLEPRHAERGTERHGLVLGGHRGGTPDGSIVDFEAAVHDTGTDERTRGGSRDRGGFLAPAPIRPARGRRIRSRSGDELVYTLHFGNTSTAATAPNALLRFPLPAGTTFVSASGGGS